MCVERWNLSEALEGNEVTASKFSEKQPEKYPRFSSILKEGSSEFWLHQTELEALFYWTVPDGFFWMSFTGFCLLPLASPLAWLSLRATVNSYSHYHTLNHSLASMWSGTISDLGRSHVGVDQAQWRIVRYILNIEQWKDGGANIPTLQLISLLEDSCWPKNTFSAFSRHQLQVFCGMWVLKNIKLTYNSLAVQPYGQHNSQGDENSIFAQ